MEKKEKALELFNKCKLHIIDTYPYENVKNAAKLICNEVLDVIEDDGVLLASNEYHDKKTVEYWLGVKEEIDLINWETLCPTSNS